MDRSVLNTLLFSLFTLGLYAQPNININNIEIVRDEFGVPHIFSETDAEAVYGIAWAQCEDNFGIMQENFATLRGRSGLLKGKDGAVMDFIVQLFELDKFVERRYEQDITPEIEVLLDAYIAGLNSYAKHHPDEVVMKNLFPASRQDILKMYTFSFIIMNLSIADVAKVAGGKLDLYRTHGDYRSAGSNAMAYSPNITEDGKTYLVGNPHLPTEGPINFWELSVHSKEGLDFFGATFSGGGVTPFIGSNRYLGWTHTTNYDDYGDVFQLHMHPTKKGYYKYDNEWLKLEKRTAKLKVKVGPIVIPVRKRFYVSKYGPTLKNKKGYFSFRNNAFFNVKQIEQWYKMAKATNYQEFWKAMEVQGIPTQTITYADHESNIMHINYALMPVRDDKFEWRKIVPGNTKATCWSYDKITPVEELVYVKNPASGYLYNCNNTPLDCTGPDENPKLQDYPKSFGILSTNTSRAKRFKELMSEHKKVSFEDIKAIRDDHSLPEDLNFRQVMNLSDIFEVAEKYDDLSNVSKLLKSWDRNFDVKSKKATLMALAGMYIEEYLFDNLALYENYIPEEKFAEALRFAKKFLLKNYGTLEVELGTVQKMVRGKKELPMYGGIETLANCHSVRHGKGKIKIKHGDTYIMYACYGKDGLESMKTVNLFGSSSKPESPHYTSQMEMYVKKEVKEVELDLGKIREKGVRAYSPK